MVQYSLALEAAKAAFTSGLSSTINAQMPNGMGMQQHPMIGMMEEIAPVMAKP